MEKFKELFESKLNEVYKRVTDVTQKLGKEATKIRDKQKGSIQDAISAIDGTTNVVAGLGDKDAVTFEYNGKIYQAKDSNNIIIVRQKGM